MGGGGRRDEGIEEVWEAMTVSGSVLEGVKVVGIW